MTVEYLAAGPPAPPRWSRTALIVVPVLLALGIAVAWAADLTRQRAQAHLESVRSSAGQQVVAGEARVLSTLAYASPMIWSAAVPESVRAGLRTLVQDTAAEVSAGLRREAEAARTTLVLPWQADQQELREQVLLQIEGELVRFDRIAADARNLADVMAG
jgi:hypothetical protein